MAAPHVAGVAARLDWGQSGSCSGIRMGPGAYGYGIVDAWAALFMGSRARSSRGTDIL